MDNVKETYTMLALRANYKLFNTLTTRDMQPMIQEANHPSSLNSTETKDYVSAISKVCGFNMEVSVLPNAFLCSVDVMCLLLVPILNYFAKI